MPHIPRLTAISSGRSSPGEAYTTWLEELRSARVDAVQIREKQIDDRVLFDLVCEAVRALTGGPSVIVNGRADITVAAGADGVHLPASGIPPRAARSLVGGTRWIGSSTHSLAEVERARDAGVDYVYFSPIYDTPGKGAPVGLDELARAAALGVPVIALGGITIERFSELAAAGAAGVAGIRMFGRPMELERLTDAVERHFPQA